jgi:nitrate reductase NapAB chaperone NapD
LEYILEKLTIHEKGVSGKPTAYDPLMKSHQWKAAKLFKDPETGHIYSNKIKIEGAKYIIEHLWSASNTDQLSFRLGGMVPAFIPVPSTSGYNVLASSFAKKLTDDLGGVVLEGFQFVDTLHQVPMKDIPSQYRPYVTREYYFQNVDKLLYLVANKAVVVVDDVFSTGASAKSFCNTLKFHDIQVHTVAGLVGDTRLTAEPQLISKLQKTLKNYHLTELRAKNIADRLSRGQITVLIDSINKTRSYDELVQIARNLQGVLDVRFTGSHVQNSRGASGTFANTEGNGISSPDAGQGVQTYSGSPSVGHPFSKQNVLTNNSSEKGPDGDMEELPSPRPRM